ncbi:hypothetical protein [Estrella lausannensis]|uniref:Methyl-accepting chemotaxis protein n=1 Tax=Estrella lausannensis TaxID=483423 RepID=A0A0H5DNH4_9BACT|nr:hypothetical protein [Estrella lausannensis]CRX37762.1 Methyl-accepting chemotaxis protein [Estrella lausannensis]
MTGMGNIGDTSSNVFFQISGGPLGSTTQTAASTTMTLADFQDVMVSLGYTEEQITNYLNNPSLPFLVTPQDTGQYVFDPVQLLNDLMSGGDGSGSVVTGENFGEVFEQRLGALLQDPSFLDEIGAASPEIAENKLKMALLNPDSVAGDKLQEVLRNLMEGAPEGWPPQAQLDVFERELGAKKDGSFEENMESMADEGDFMALRNAYYNNKPEQLTDAQKTMFNQIMAASNSQLQTIYGIPPNIQVPSPGAEYFNTSVNVNFEDDFKTKLVEMKLLGDLGLPGGITEQEFNTLRSMLYFNDPTNSQQSALQGKFQDLYNSILSEFKADNGLPEQWTPERQTAVGQAWADGVWRSSFMDNLNALSIPTEMKAQILAALANPAGADPIIQAMLGSLVDETTAGVIQSLGLPATWAPQAKTVDSNVPAASLLMARAGIANLQGIYNAGLEALAAMPPNDPNRSLLIDYLKRIGDSLSKLQEMMYIVESSSAKVSKTLGAAVQDMQQNKIDEAAKQAEEARNQKDSKGYKKQHDEGKQTFMKIFGPIMAVIMAILAVMTGNPALMAIALFMLANSLSQAFGGPDLMQKVFELVGKLVEKIGKALGLSESAISALSMLTKILLIVAVVVVCLATGGGSMVGSMILMQFIMDAVMKSDLILDGMKISDPDPDPEEIAKVTMAVMITMMAVMMTVMIVQMIVMTVLTGGAGAAPAAGMLAGIGAQLGAMAGQLAGAISTFITALGPVGQIIMKIVEAIQKVVEMVIKLLQKLMEIIQKVMNFVKDVAKAVGDIIKNVARAIVDAVDDLLKALSKGASEILSKTPQFVQNAARSVQDTVSQIAQKIQDLANQFIKFLKNSSVVQKIQQFFKDQADAWSKMNSGEKMSKVANYMQNAVDITIGLNSAVSGITQAQYAMMMAELVKLQAKSEAYIEEVEALIKMLKKIIENLLEGMGPITEFIQDINSLQVKKYEDASSAGGWDAVAS